MSIVCSAGVPLHGKQLADWVYPLKVTREFMPLYLSGFLRQHAALAPRLVRRQNTHVDLDPATPQRIGHHTDRDLTRCRVKHIGS